MSERKIKGTIIRHCRDEYGEMFVADNSGTRSLYFGDGILQSSISIDQPATLIEDYNQAMMSALIFKNDPESVLVIGLGGCSMVHFLLTAFPDCAIDVVEIRKDVISIACDLFLLPEKNPNLRIFHAAGQNFIMNHGKDCEDYDMIFVDAFDDEGPASALSEMPFLSACRTRLKKNGICVLNFWSRPKDKFPSLYAGLQEAFEGRTLKLVPADKYWNAIAFGFIDRELIPDMPAYRRKAVKLQEAYNINFPKYLRYLCWHNFS